MQVGAGRHILRQGYEPYGVQQARKLYNPRKRDRATPSANPKKDGCGGIYTVRKKGEGKAGASRRGKTSSSSVRDYY